MLDYDLALLFLIICVLAPVFLASFLIGNKDEIGNEDFIGACAFLVRDFKEKILFVIYHVIFLVRRLVLIASLYLLHDYPTTQVILISVVCWIVIFI